MDMQTSFRGRLVEAGTRITQMGMAGDSEVDAIVDRAQAEVYEVTSRRAAEDYLPLADIMGGTLAELEAKRLRTDRNQFPSIS